MAESENRLALGPLIKIIVSVINSFTKVDLTDTHVDVLSLAELSVIRKSVILVPSQNKGVKITLIHLSMDFLGSSRIFVPFLCRSVI